ncbi:MAG: formylmethanofuran dehydrogenase subunit A [Thermoprotei archaeon]|nr:MAG: formylmethanofuran dehydrogenase subunit A [Thermoprotei archaeon]
MTQILIKNGIVFDPINGINGEVMDIAIKNGKIVESTEIDESKAMIIDARGKVVMAGGIDIHSHIAGPKVNVGRLLRPEDHYLTNKPHVLPHRRAETGLTVPNVFRFGYEYARMGYTFVVEPATPPIKTRHTHEELNAIPIIDKAAFVLVDSNWIALDLISEASTELLAAYFAWLLSSTKTLALKLVDPGSDVAWLIKGKGIDLDDQIPGYDLTPRDIIREIGNASQLLRLPHKMHVHCNRLGYPGNYLTTLKTMDIVREIKRVDDGPALHITHVQFTGYKGDSWTTLRSGGEDIAEAMSRNPYVSLDLGQVIPGRPATTMTADAPFEFVLYHLTRWKWASADTEVETAAGIVPYVYRKRNYVNTIQWVIGLEVALISRDPWRIIPTTDHPNAGPFTDYPKMFAWLLSKKAREDDMRDMSQLALKRSALPSINTEFTLYDLAVMTRAAPAKLLGLEKRKGHLGVGADADVAIYDIDPREVEISKNYKKLIQAFKRTWLVIKDGVIVVKEGEVVKTIYGRTYYAEPVIPSDLEKEVKRVLEKKFKEYYSITLDSFIINEEEIRNPVKIKISTQLTR